MIPLAFAVAILVTLGFITYVYTDDWDDYGL